MTFKSLLRSLFTLPPANTGTLIGQFPSYPINSLLTYVQTYCENASVYTIVSMMAKKWATLPRYLSEIEDEGEQNRYKHALKHNSGMHHAKLVKLYRKAYKAQLTPSIPTNQRALMQLLKQPNPYMGQDSFYALIYTYKKLTGNSYVWLNRGLAAVGKVGKDRLKYPVEEMYVLPSNFMSMIVNTEVLMGQIVCYTLNDRGQFIYFEPEDIIHWRDPNPKYDGYTFTHFYGVSPLEPGMPLIMQDRAGRDAMVAMYQNGGARGILNRRDAGKETPEQAAARKSAIDTKINYKSQKGAVVSLQGDWLWQQMGASAVDMELVDAQDKVFARICNLLGCNPQIFQSDSTFNNVEQARKDLVTNAILPDACSYRDEENRMLLPAFNLQDSKWNIDIDVTDVPELQDDIEKLTKSTITNWTLTPNEMREELGFPPSTEPGMDENYIPQNLILIEDAAVPTSGLSDDPGDGTRDNLDGTDARGIGSGADVSGQNPRKRLLAAAVSKEWDDKPIRI